MPPGRPLKIERNFFGTVAFLLLNLMRTRLFITFIALLLTGGAYPARAQEAGGIVGQYVKTAGGGRGLAKIQTVTPEGAFSGGEGKAGRNTLGTKRADR